MDLTIKAQAVDISRTGGFYNQSLDLDIREADEEFLTEIYKKESIPVLLADKTEAEIRSFVVNEFDWVKNLLHDFWQRSSDACPLESNEEDAQELEFIKYVNSL